MNNVDAVRATLHDALRADERTLILGEDVGTRGNVFLITRGFLDEFGPERIIDTPLAEASIVGIAIGMAMEGLRPIAEIQFADFIYPAFNQIVGEAAKTRYRSKGDYTCPLVIRTPYGGGVHGALSHSVSIEALFYHVPGLKILAPSYPADIKGLLTAAIEDPDPVLFLEHKKTYRSVKGEVPDGRYVLPIGKAEIKHAGDDVSVVSYGYNVHQAVDAAHVLAGEGISVEVIDLRSIRPMDRNTILDSVRKTHKLLIIHEDNKFGGVGAEIAAMVAEEALFELDAPIRRVCGPDVPAMGYAITLEEEFMISTDRMVRANARVSSLLAMPTTITMPRLGETVTEGTVAQWLKKVDDVVEKYEAFVEVSTDKVNAEVPSPVSGTIRELIVSEGQTVPTGAPIAIIDETAAVTLASTEPTVGRSAPVTDFSPPAHSVNGNGKPAATNGSLRGASPAVRRLAREYAIDMSAVHGTGTNGRVTARDVVAAAGVAATQREGTVTPAVAPQAAPASPSRSTYAKPIPGELLPLTQARRIIAQRMVESKQTAPHAWTMVEVDVTNLWAWRLRETDAFEQQHGHKLTLFPFFMRAVVESLAAFPLMNATFTPDGILVHKDVNMGMAVAVESSLLVPVIRGASGLSIKGLALAAGDIILRARRGKLGPDELRGGTFTVNNTGANGSILSAPILVTGQAGIVTMEAVVKRVVVRADDAIQIRSMMNVCLSLDHRVVDGAGASSFLADLKRRLEAMGPTGSL